MESYLFSFQLMYKSLFKKMDAYDWFCAPESQFETDRQLDRQSPVEVSHHEALEVVGGEAAEGGPGQVTLGRLVTGLTVQLWVPQRHANVVQQPRQRPQLQDGVLKKHKHLSASRLTHTHTHTREDERRGRTSVYWHQIKHLTTRHKVKI